MDDIILKLSNVETIIDANETMHCEFISAILHASIAITKKLTSQDIFSVTEGYFRRFNWLSQLCNQSSRRPPLYHQRKAS